MMASARVVVVGGGGGGGDADEQSCTVWCKYRFLVRLIDGSVLEAHKGKDCELPPNEDNAPVLLLDKRVNGFQ